MKKIILTMSVLLTMAIATPTLASAQSNETANCTQQTCVNANCADENAKTCTDRNDRKDKKDRHHRHGRKDSRKDGRRGTCDNQGCRPGAQGQFAAFLFDGIQLTDSQKAGIDVLDNRLKTERKDFDEATAARVKAEKQKMREESRQKYDAGVKEILTADQYAKFQENKAKMTAKRDEMKAKKQAVKDAQKEYRAAKADMRSAGKDLKKDVKSAKKDLKSARKDFKSKNKDMKSAKVRKGERSDRKEQKAA